MASFSEHYKAAEEALFVFDTKRDPDDWSAAIASGELTLAAQVAQAHAILAVARQMADVVGHLQEIRDEIARSTP
jgi:hypothetical protein